MLHSELDWRIGLQKLLNHLHQDVILRYESQLNITQLSSNPKLSRDFIRRNFMRFDNDTYANPRFDDTLMREFLHAMDCSYSDLHNKQSWKKLSANPSLTVAFINEHFHKFDSAILSKNRVLSREYILEHADKHIDHALCANPNIDLVQLYDITVKIHQPFGFVMQHPDLTVEFCKEHNLEYIQSRSFDRTTGPIMSPEFIRKNNANRRNCDLWTNPRFTLDLIEELIVPNFASLNTTHFGWVLDNPTLTPEFMLRHIWKFSSTSDHLIKMATHPNATLDFIEAILPF
jgi:hypothetical protein